MTRSLKSLQSLEGLATIIVTESALKGWIARTSLSALARAMVFRMVLSFLLHRGRMTCSQATGSVASEAIHRGRLTRFLARPRWQREDFNAPLRAELLRMESGQGKFIFIIDVTLVSQAGLQTQNTFSTGNRQRRPKKGRRYNQKKVHRKKCHSFTFGLLLTPSGYPKNTGPPDETDQNSATSKLTLRVSVTSHEGANSDRVEYYLRAWGGVRTRR